MAALLTELEIRWRKIFEALANGADVAPSLRLRTEGLMEAAVLAGEATAEGVSQAMADAYEVSFGRSLAQDFDPGWQEFFPFPQIPAMAKRAPVYPSTLD